MIGGYLDEEFESDTKLFLNRIENKDFLVHLSEISTIELQPAPRKVKEIVKKITNDCLVYLDFTRESQELANNYILEKILGKALLKYAHR